MPPDEGMRFPSVKMHMQNFRQIFYYKSKMLKTKLWKVYLHNLAKYNDY